MNERSVWSLALGDILGVVSSPTLIHALQSMSLQALRSKAVFMARNAKLFEDDVITPARRQQIDWPHQNMAKIRAIPGGSGHIVTMLGDGTLCLYSVQDGNLDLHAELEAGGGSDLRPVSWEKSALFLGYSQQNCIAVTSEPILNPVAYDITSRPDFSAVLTLLS